MRHLVNFAQASQLCAKFSCAELQNSGIPSSSGKRRRRGKGYLGDIQAFTFTLSGLPTVSVLDVLNIFHMGSSNVASGYQ